MKLLTLNLALTDNAQKKAKYLRIAAAIRESIKQSHVAPGEILPSARKLALQLKTNRHTIMAAFNELIAEGWVESKQRSCYFVVESLPIQNSLHTNKVRSKKSSFNNTSSPETSFKWQFNRQGIQQPKQKANELKYNFSGGQPDLNLFPFDEFKSYFTQSCQRPEIESLSYGDSKGLPKLIKEYRLV